MFEYINGYLLVILGSVVTLIPQIVDKFFELRKERERDKYNSKQERYVKLISLLSTATDPYFSGTEKEELGRQINLINITGSLEVVNALNSYLRAWTSGDKSKQQEPYRRLIKAIREDLEIEKRKNKDIPDVELWNID